MTRPRTVACLALGLGLAALAGPNPATAQQTVYVREAAPAWLGVSYEMRWIQQGESCSPQVVVEAVVQGSPAERAGLRAGDAVLSLNGEPTPGRLNLISSRLAPGDTVHLEFQRDGVVREAVAVADRRPDRPLRIFIEGASTLRRTPVPVIERVGDTLMARNVGPDWDPGRTRAYWVVQDDGSTEYRTLGGWSRSGLDERVSNLLACADRAQMRAPVWAEGAAPLRVDIERFQARADSLRVVLAQRALQRQEQAGVVRQLPDSVRVRPSTVQMFGPDGSFTFRVEEHVAVGMRAIAGAELTAMEPELADYFRNAEHGLLVLRIAPDTPAERAGLRPGDVVLAADGRRVQSVAELRRIIALPDAGAVELQVVRKGRTRDLTLRRN